MARLAGAHPRGREQPDQRVPRQRFEPRRQGIRGGKQCEDLVLAEHVWLLWPVSPAADRFGRDFRGRVQRVLISGEDPYRIHPAGEQSVTDGNLDPGRGPFHREVFLHAGSPACLAERDEAPEQLAQTLDLEAHRPARGEVVPVTFPRSAFMIEIPATGEPDSAQRQSSSAPPGGAPRPRPRKRPQGNLIDLGVDRGGQLALRWRSTCPTSGSERPGPQHRCGQRVTQTVRARSGPARPVWHALADDMAGSPPTISGRTGRSARVGEHRPRRTSWPRRRSRHAASRFSRPSAGSRQPFNPVALADDR